MKFTTSTSVKKVAKPMAKAVKLPSQTELRASYLNLCAVTGHLKEVDMLVDNMTMAIAALSRKDATAETIRVLNIDKGLESLLGVAEKAITKQMALEGLGQQLRAGWNALVDFIVKCVTAVRDFVGKFLQTSGHMVRTVKANINKVDFNAKLNIPSKADVNALDKTYEKLCVASGAAVTKLLKIDLGKLPPDAQDVFNNPYVKNIKNACDQSNGILIFDESTGEITMNMSFEVKEQSLSEAGYSPTDLNNICSPILPDWIRKMTDSLWKVGKDVRNFNIDKVGIAAGAVAGVVSQNAEEATANFIKTYKTWWNVVYSSYRIVMKGSGLMTRVAAQAYKTLPAELKKRI